MIRLKSDNAMSHSRRWVCRWAARFSSAGYPSTSSRSHSYASYLSIWIVFILLLFLLCWCWCFIFLVLLSLLKMTIMGSVLPSGDGVWSRWTPLSPPSQISHSWTPICLLFRRSSSCRWFQHSYHRWIWICSWRCVWNLTPWGSIFIFFQCWFPPCSSWRWMSVLSHKLMPPLTEYSCAHRRSRRMPWNKSWLTFLLKDSGEMDYQPIYCCAGKPRYRNS